MALNFIKKALVSGFNTTDLLTENFTNIETAAADGLSRSGNTPNEMNSSLDMNSNRILNLPGAVQGSEPLTKSQFDAATGSLTPVGFQVEQVIATAGQTLITLSSVTYTLGANTLVVFINGVYQSPGNYTENTTSTFTLSSGAQVGDKIDVIVLSVS